MRLGAFGLVLLSLGQVAAAPGPALDARPSATVARAGEDVAVEIHGAIPGERVLLDGLRAVANGAGVATFLLPGADAGVSAHHAESPGRAPATFTLVRVAPRIVLDVPSTAWSGGAAEIRAVATWGANLTPAPGVELGLASGGSLLATAVAGATGGASFVLHRFEPGLVEIAVAADDPLFRDATASAAILWIEPPAPPPPGPSAPAPPAPSAPNVAPSLGGVRIVLDGLVARAEVDGVSDPDGDPVFVSFVWNVDGERSAGPSVAVTRGSRVELVASAYDGRGGSATASASLVVPPDLPPTAHVEISGLRVAGEVLVFDASGSADPEGGPLRWSWRFSDGTSAEGPVARRAFDAGDVWAEVVIEDAAGGRAASRVDLVVQPQASADPAPNASLPPGATLERVLRAGAAPLQLVRTAAGPAIWDPSRGELAPVVEQRLAAAATRYRPGLVATDLDLGAEGRWRLVRVRDPQPGLDFLGAYDEAGVAAFSWREGGDVVLLSRAARAHVDHALPPLRLAASLEEREHAFHLLASVEGGAPVASLRVEGPEGVVVDVTERALQARLAPGPEPRSYRVVVETLAGERREQTFEIPGAPEVVPLEPTSGAAEVGGATRDRTPAPGGLGLLAVVATAAATVRRRE